MAIKLRLYSREGCHLCDEMLDELMSMDIASQLHIQIVDIDTDPVTQRQFALRIPVLVAADNNEIICEQTLDHHAVVDYLITQAGP
jgi:hypothetical protein